MAGIDDTSNKFGVADVSPSQSNNGSSVAICNAPVGGLFRVGRAVDPMRASWATLSVEASATQGNRFDTAEFGVIYMGTTLEACFGETLARYRPKADLARLVAEDWQGFMAPGQMPADWREHRSIAHAVIHQSERFLDVEALETREHLRGALALGLSSLGHQDLDVPVVRGPDRRVTRLIAKWAYALRDQDNIPIFAGIRYLSKIKSEWECWALFEDTVIDRVSAESVRVDEPALERVAQAFGIRVH